jgi:peptidoglycan-associated lipoprotein
MRKKLWIYLALLLVIPGFLFISSCARQTVQEAEEPAPEVEAVEEAPVAQEEPTEAAAEQPSEEMPEGVLAARNMFLTENVHFAFDKSNLNEEAQAVLRRKAEFLQDNPDIYITIEGHCDPRGTNEYNLALGDRRAESSKAFLLDSGIESYRISTVSYGEERRFCLDQTEECWAKDRRAAFVIN